uniref:Phosphoribulokinase/uridine kinase domain-containing protein n=1 Tax=Biomphalaria glabrata TaxID=6526 RepID=A0A2C9K7H5_BIOGL
MTTVYTSATVHEHRVAVGIPVSQCKTKKRISGFTNSGKSTIATMLSKEICNLDVMNQDLYFLEPDDPAIERDIHGIRNFEKLSALDMERMVQDVKLWIKSKTCNSDSLFILLIEGFLIFNHKELSDLIDHKYFIKITKEICFERRIKRQYIPPDPDGYFDSYVWPWTITNLMAIQDCTDIEFIDGTADLQALYKSILTRIMKIVFIHREKYF